ncbi:MAG: YgiQ family radical SAM protein [Lachnospiraceae bacterium]|nr:YgiQ family radical SAM protein [Lachnospiraceae bacterium]
MPFLPMTLEECQKQNVEQLDFVYIIGDAYVDHPSFGHAIISRVLESFGYTVGIISQPDWKNPDSIKVLGKPRLAFLITAGNMDSMVNHYYVSKKRRTIDAYTPGGACNRRPDHAAVVYSNLVRSQYKDTPIILGGIEASLRRMAHYDYWSDSLKRSILLDSGADLISYGMGEKSIVEIADALNSGMDVKDLTFIRGTVYKARNTEHVCDGVMLPSFMELKEEKKQYAQSFAIQYENTDPYSGKTLIEPYEHDVYVIQNPPSFPLTEMEMDDIYALPYMRRSHPSYDALGGVPATKEIQFSLISNRGCFGGCNFCALTFHQGRIVQTRSHESIIKEAVSMTEDPDFKGYIHDVGGPTANFRAPSCEKQLQYGVCKNKQCLFPKPCSNLKADHSDYVSLLRKLRKLPNVKKVFIRSGIRFDYLLCDKDDTFFHELLRYHVSGQLKVAPEHISDAVLCRMGKPENAVYERFMKKYEDYNEKIGKKQYLVPYLMSSHPGSTLKEAIELAEYIRDLGYMPQQVQDFYPTPSTMSTVMYYTGIDPRDMKPVYVVKNPHEKAMQRALIQYKNPENYELVKEALLKMHREDLIGFGPKCLIPPRKMEKKGKAQNLGQKNANFKNQKHKNGKGIKTGNSGKNKMSSKNNSNTVNRKKRK